MMRRLLFVLACLLPLAASAAEEPQFDNPAQEARYQAINHELRCLVCQGQSVAESNADLAQDLRAQVYRMIKEGKSDQDIRDFMVARYGDFVLLTPPVKPQTYALWFGPFVLLALALGVAVALLRRRRGASGISESDHHRAREILAAAEKEDAK